MAEMLQQKNMGNRYSDVVEYLKGKTDGIAMEEKVIIKLNDAELFIPKDILVLTSPFIRNILGSYPHCLEPLIMIPGVDSATVKEVIDVLLGDTVVRENVRTDVVIFCEML